MSFFPRLHFESKNGFPGQDHGLILNVISKTHIKYDIFWGCKNKNIVVAREA